MVSQRRLSSVMQIMVSVLGFILSMVLYCTTNGAWFNGFTAAIFLAFGGIFIAVTSALKKIR